MASPTNAHIHHWHTFTKPDMLICSDGGCGTVAKLKDVLVSAAVQAAHSQKVSLLGGMLFNRELKKGAHDKYYAWLMSQSSTEKQTALL